MKGLASDERLKPNQNLEYTIERNTTRQVIAFKSGKNKYITAKVLGVMGILILSIGILIFYQNRNILSFVFFLYCFVMAIHWGSYPQVISVYSQNIVISIYIFVTIFLGSLILHIGLIFPESQVISFKKYLIIYAPGIIGTFLFIAILLNMDLLPTLILVEPILVSLFALAGAILLFRTYFKTSKNIRSSIGINVICLGILIGNLPYLLSTFLPFMDFGGSYGALLYRLFFILNLFHLQSELVE